ncbi:MAG TPA: ATPase, T2SS/T4P/T4SS family [Candidatus Dormibacteraeota bacterium]|nr:ATPase, T2SS/T4P/T4SS family [Candidatus Dormibacteraeota bacterium]
MPAEPPPLDPGMLSAVRSRLALELEPGLADPFADVAGRERLIREALARVLLETRPDEPVDDGRVDHLYGELVGLGPLQPLMDDELTTDILVNRWDEVFVERAGRLQRTGARFRDQAHLEQLIAKIVALVGREISVDKPLVDARMTDGSRANAVYAPVGGPCLCIRKFNRLRLSLLPEHSGGGLDWVSLRGMDETMARFLSVAALARANMLVAGATGSGKSTLLRSIVDAFPEDERIVTIEDTAELELGNPHWVRLECVHEHRLEGRDTSVRRLDVADLVQNALRMRPDRLIIGEIRNSREAYHTLEALNTGHDGSATTIHAGTAADALGRLELLVGRSFGQLSPPEIRGYIARVFDIVVVVARLRGGRRCVLEICELAGLDGRGGYDLRPVFCADTEERAGEREPVFRAVPAYAPGPRLTRKLELEGIRWIS